MCSLPNANPNGALRHAERDELKACLERAEGPMMTAQVGELVEELALLRLDYAPYLRRAKRGPN